MPCDILTAPEQLPELSLRFNKSLPRCPQPILVQWKPHFVRACPRRQTTSWSQTVIRETVKHPRGPPPGSWYTCIALWNLHKRPRLVVLGALALYLIVLTIQHQAGKLLPGRVLSDPFDIHVYYKRAQFYPQSKTPYAEVFSEYPALATLSFAAPLLLDKNMPLANYRLAWNFFMACFFAGTVLLVYNSRVLLGLDTTPLLLFASPTVLYFSLMRFDILCAFFVSLSVYLYLKEKYFLSYVILAAAIHVKWYPALILPVYLAHHLYREGLLPPDIRWRERAGRFLRSSSAQYGFLFLFVSGLLALASIAAFGWQGFLVPHLFHGGRPAEAFTLYWMAEWIMTALGWRSSILWGVTDRLFLVAQFSIVFVLLIRRITSFSMVARYGALSVFLFITFCKINSPQWILWYLPILLVFVRRMTTIYCLAILTMLNFAVFPVAYDLTTKGLTFGVTVLLRDAMLVSSMVLIFTKENRCGA